MEKLPDDGAVIAGVVFALRVWLSFRVWDMGSCGCRVVGLEFRFDSEGISSTSYIQEPKRVQLPPNPFTDPKYSKKTDFHAQNGFVLCFLDPSKGSGGGRGRNFYGFMGLYGYMGYLSI